MCSLTASRNDRQVAIGSANRVGFYAVDLQQLRWVNMPATPVLPDAKNVESQVMAYSSDGTFLAVATYYDIQATRLCVFDADGTAVFCKLLSMPQVSNSARFHTQVRSATQHHFCGNLLVLTDMFGKEQCEFSSEPTFGHRLSQPIWHCLP